MSRVGDRMDIDPDDDGARSLEGDTGWPNGVHLWIWHAR